MLYEDISLVEETAQLIKELSEAVALICSVKEVFLQTSQNSQENTCASLFFNKVAGQTLFLKNLAQVFSCEFCEIRKNTFSTEHIWWMFLKCYEQGAYLGPCQAFRCSFLAKTVNRYKPLAIFARKLHHRCLARS